MNPCTQKLIIVIKGTQTEVKKKEIKNLLYVVVELLRDLPAGVALLVLRVFELRVQICVDQAGNATPGEALLHLST